MQPHGPYLLGGFSGGGITAYEMAQQLDAAGEEVALLVLLDTPLPMRASLLARDRALMKWQRDPRARVPATSANGRRTASTGSSASCAPASRSRPPPPEHAFHNEAIEAAFRAALPGLRHASPGPDR